MSRRGFSLIELMLALGITSVVVAGISIVLLKQSQASVKMNQQRTLEETGRQALLEIARPRERQTPATAIPGGTRLRRPPPRGPAIGPTGPTSWCSRIAIRPSSEPCRR